MCDSCAKPSAPDNVKLKLNVVLWFQLSQGASGETKPDGTKG